MVAMRVVVAACAGFAVLAITSPAIAQDAESRVYAAAKSCDGLRSYLRAYPDGRFRANANARIAEECGSAAAKPISAEKPKPKTGSAPATPQGDPCIQARADWTQISASQDVTVLQGFVTGLPKACSTQRAQAQARLDALQSAAYEKKRVEWKGVPEFDGVWVLDTSAPNAKCGNFPWRHAPNGQYIRRIYGNGDTRDMRVESTSPPALHVLENNKGRAVIEGQRIRVEDKNGNLDCYLKRQ